MLLDTNDGTNVEVPADTVKKILENSNAKEIAIGHTEPVYGENSISFENFDIIDENGIPIDLEAMNNTVPVTVVINVGDAFAVGESIVVYHDGEIVATATVDSDKNITYTTTHFSKVDISYNDGIIDSVEEFATALVNGGDVKLESDITINETIVIPEGKKVNLDLNGKTISSGYQSGSTSKHIYPINNYGELTITNGTIAGRGIYNRDGAKITVNGAKIVSQDTNGGACIWSYGSAKVYLNNATLIGYTG
jgi:hypothetical protein